MADKSEIDKAVSAHGMWKARLRTAIDTGKLDTPVDTIRVDDQCGFGKWLFGPTLTSVDKASKHYKTVKELHAEFHRSAGRVALLATSGRNTEAEQLMSVGGEYSAISAKLTRAMLEWRNSRARNRWYGIATRPTRTSMSKAKWCCRTPVCPFAPAGPLR